MKNQNAFTQAVELVKQLDSSTFNHSARTMQIATEVEKYLGLTNEKLKCAALLHDIGKSYIPFEILDKKGKLNSMERELIDLHPYFGYCTLNSLGVDEDICRIVLYHHSFYPLTIHPLSFFDIQRVYDEAKMLHTIDVFEALTSDRPYHRGLCSSEALEILHKEDNCDEKTLTYLEKSSVNEEIVSAVHRSGKRPARPTSFNNLLAGLTL